MFYPVIYDDSKGCAVLDSGCPRRDEFKISGAGLKELAFIVARLGGERRTRKAKD